MQATGNDKPNMSVSKVHWIYVLYGSTMGHHQLVLFLGRQFNSISNTHSHIICL
jgi:hypothetical protein